MKLPEAMQRLSTIVAQLEASGVDPFDVEVVLWGCERCDVEASDESELPRVTRIDYDKFGEDEPHVVLIEKDGDP